MRKIMHKVALSALISLSVIALLYIKAFYPCRKEGNIKTLKLRREQWSLLVSKVKAEAKSHRVPDVIGIGVRKCGTGPLKNFLKYHPLLNAWDTEAHYYDKYLYKGVDYYKKILPQASSSQLIMEKTPAYFTSLPSNLPSIVKHDSPQVKLLLIVCDPVLRAFSDYAMRDARNGKGTLGQTFEEYIDVNFEPVKTMFKNLTMKDDRFTVADVMTNLLKTKHRYTFAHGIYAYFIRRWMDVFSPKQLMVIDGDRFMRDPGAIVERVQDFFNIPKILSKADFVKHPETGLYCLCPWWNHTCDSEAYQFSETSWKSYLICAADSKGRTRSKNPSYAVNSESIEKLRKFYKPYNEMLYSMLNQRFDW